MKYQMSLYGGEKILLENDQYSKILMGWDSGAEEFAVGDRRIPRKAVSYLGFTDGATEEMRTEDTQYIMSLPAREAKQLKEQRYRDACQIGAAKAKIMLEGAKGRVWKSISGAEAMKIEIPEIERLSQGMTVEESERGSAEYYLSESGEKMYS